MLTPRSVATWRAAALSLISCEATDRGVSTRRLYDAVIAARVAPETRRSARAPSVLTRRESPAHGEA